MVINPQVEFLNSKVLLIDIGGTNIRTAVADIGSNKLINPNKQSLESLDKFDEMLQNFLNENSSIRHLVFSIAGPKLHQSISMTNREFRIDAAEILKEFSVDSCHLLNDWEAIGHGLSLFAKDDMHFINTGDPFNDTALILGPGTGLGVAQVVNDSIVLPTEIGNSLFTIPNLLLDIGLTSKTDINIIEDLISGGGLVKIYSHLAKTNKSSEEILNAYHSDEFAKKSVELFLKSFSQILSELALAFMPGKGIYLAGGLIRSLYGFLDADDFIKNFVINRKSMHEEVLLQMPIALIKQEMTCLHGSLNFINKFSQTLD